jgi:predicted dehydrogenase
MSTRLGLIGVGRWGKRYVQTIAKLEQAQLTHLCTRHPENAKLLSNPVQITNNWRELCRNKQIDGVIIASPPETHAEILRECLEAGKPALVEKPLCMSSKDAVMLQELNRKLKIPVLVDHTQLFQPAYEKISNEFPNPEDIKFIHSEGEDYGPFRKDASVLWDRAPHDLALCLDLLKELPVSVSCIGAVSWNGLPAHSQMLILKLCFKSDVVCWINVGHLATQKRRFFSVFGENRAFVFDDLAQDKLKEFRIQWSDRCNNPHQILEKGVTVAIAPEFPLTRAVLEFVNGIKGNLSNKFGLDLAVNVIRLLEAAQQSLESERPVKLAIV